MKFIPIEYPKEIINGQEYMYILEDCRILQRRRQELNLTQQQVADEAGIQLRQYQRVESGERHLTSCGARIMLAVCAVLRIDPYEFYPTIKQKEIVCTEEKMAKSTATSSVTKPAMTVTYIPAKSSKYIHREEYNELVMSIPEGKITRDKDIREYLQVKHNVEVVEIDTSMPMQLVAKGEYPWWRVVSDRGMLYPDTKFYSRDLQQKILREEGFNIVPCGANKRSLKVENYREYLYDFNE